MARYALVIGITQNISPLQTLEKSIADANAIASLLREVGDFRVELLTKPEETTCKALGVKLQEFFQQRALRHEALIYYTGHGFPLVDALGETQAYLAPSDCVVEMDADGRVVAQKNGLSLSGLSGLAAKAELSNLVMLLDCCNSGFLLEESLLKQTFTSFIQKDYWLMTACRSFESAYAKRSEKYSIFTGALVRGLARERANERGEITAGGLFNFVAEALRGEPQEIMQLSVGRPIVMVRYPLLKMATPAVTVDDTNPYQSLFAFTPETAKFFFGRENEISNLVQQVQDCNFVPVIGASGSGKSSLVRAGLMPRLLELGWQVWEPLKPGAEPLVSLKLLVGGLFPAAEREEIYRVLEQQGLGAIASRLPGEERILLIVDQFEEVFTLCQNRQHRQQFIKCLMSVKQSDNHRLVVVTTMRADFVEPWLTSGVLTQAIQNDALFLGALAGENLEDAIDRPAKTQGYNLQPGLLELILRDVAAEENCLPLMEFALTQLWENRDRVKHELTVNEYKALGGWRGTLDRYAETIYDELLVRNQGEWAKRIMLRLTRTNREIVKDTRQRRTKKELLEMGKNDEEIAQIDETLDRLINGHLLVTDDDVVNIDLSHESLMDGWKRFSEWREDGREQRRLLDTIEEERREWERNDKLDEYLLEGRLLKEAVKLLNQPFGVCLSANIDYIEKSINHKKNIENRESFPGKRSLFFLLAIVIIVAVVGFNSLQDNVDQHYLNIENSTTTLVNERRSVQALTKGCSSQEKNTWVSEFIRARNCESLEESDLDNSNLAGINLRNVNLGKANLIQANLEQVDLSGAILSDAKLNSANLQGATLSSATLTNANLQKANLENTDFQKAYLRSANLDNAYLFNANLSNADLKYANFQNSNLRRANLRNSNLEKANLSDAFFRKVNMSKANLYKALLSKAFLDIANLNAANLQYVNLSNANLTLADMENTNLTYANMKNANLTASDMRNANLSGANLENVLFEECYKTTQLENARICTNMEGIKWDEKTNWQGIKGWENVVNIPPELKKQLNLPYMGSSASPR